MLSMPFQPTINGTLTSQPSSVFKNLTFEPLKTPFSVNPGAFHLNSLPNLTLKIEPINRRTRRPPVAAAATGVAPEETLTELAPQPEKVKVEVKLEVRPRLKLKFIWMEKNIGLALDQQIPGHGTVPLSPYFFWPRKDAWEELKATLESRPWISQKKMIILLNQATDIINLWQQSGGNLS